MRPTAILAAIVGVGTSTVAAQTFNTSAPFNLIVLSTNATLNGSTLGACHEGAAIEGLCVGALTASSPTYNFNTSCSGCLINATIGETGIITYSLVGGNFVDSEGLGLYYSTSSNVALPLFYPGDEQATYVAFDSNDLLNIPGYIDDTVSPPTDAYETPYYRWYVCVTNYEGYTYTTLAWTLGTYPPENPSCVKVDVKRVFV